MNKALLFLVIMLINAPVFAMEDLEQQANTPSIERGANVLYALWSARQAQDRNEGNSAAESPIFIDPNEEIEPLSLDEQLKSLGNLGKYHCDTCAVAFENQTLAVVHNQATKHVPGFRYFEHPQAQVPESGSNNNNSSNAAVSRLLTENLSPRLNTQFGNRFTTDQRPTHYMCECTRSFVTRKDMLIHMGTNDHRNGSVINPKK